MTVPFGQMDLNALLAALKSFNPERLSVAREAAGLDIKELAERIGASPSAVSQLESGRTKEPKAETLLRLSLALGVPPAFFGAARVPKLAADSCHFRKKRSTSKREQRNVLARGRLVREIVGYLEELIDFPQVSLQHLQRSVSSRSEIEALALTVRDAWNLGQGPIANMVALAEWHGVIPVEVEGHSQDLDAFSTWADGRPMVFLAIEKASATRRRYDIAHELGHLLMHGHCVAGDKALEREADAFGGAFLLPRTPFLAECPVRLSWPKLREMKQRWGVSMLAIIRRAFDLGVFSEATYRRAHVQYARFGWRTQGEPDEPLLERPTLIARCVAQLDTAGQSVSVTAAQLNHGTRLFESLISPVGAVEVGRSEDRTPPNANELFQRERLGSL
jgi:Zn-dependent peptidase ImmA (M78 family)/DNA-binding XRE family transcriptional regulator